MLVPCSAPSHLKLQIQLSMQSNASLDYIETIHFAMLNIEQWMLNIVIH